MSSPHRPIIPPQKQLAICLLFLVFVRVYYLLIESNMRTLHSWFDNYPWFLLVVYLLAILCATGGALAARHGFSKLLIIPTGIACGALATLMHNSLPGGFIGFLCGLFVFSSWLRNSPRQLWRPVFLAWLPTFLIGLLLGFAVAQVTLQGNPVHAWLLIGQWCLGLIGVGGATTLMMSSSLMARRRSIRCLIALGIIFSLGVGFLRIH